MFACMHKWYTVVVKTPILEYTHMRAHIHTHTHTQARTRDRAVACVCVRACTIFARGCAACTHTHQVCMSVCEHMHVCAQLVTLHQVGRDI